MKRTLDELLLLVATALDLLRRAWRPALVSWVGLGLLGIVPALVGTVVFCFLTYLATASIGLAFFAAGPIAAFGIAARGREPTVREVFVEARASVGKLVAVYLGFSFLLVLPIWLAVLSEFVSRAPFEGPLARYVFLPCYAFLMLWIGARYVVLAAPLVVLERERFPGRGVSLRSPRAGELATGRLAVLLVVKLCPLAIVVAAHPGLAPGLGAPFGPMRSLRAVVFLASLPVAAFVHALLATSAWAIATGLAKAPEEA